MEIYNGTYCVYIHTNKINGKMYVGQTVNGNDPNKRWKNGEGYNKQIFYRAIEKYGWDGFKHEIIASNLTEDEANNFEELLIQKLDTRNPDKGYNISAGGRNATHSDNTKAKMSEKHKELWQDEEYKNHMSEVHKGKNAGENHPFFGKQFSEEHKQKLKENHWDMSSANNPKARRVAQYTKDGELIKIWECISDACRALGLKTANVVRCCQHRKGYKTSGGYIWEYYEEVAEAC